MLSSISRGRLVETAFPGWEREHRKHPDDGGWWGHNKTTLLLLKLDFVHTTRRMTRLSPCSPGCRLHTCLKIQPNKLWPRWGNQTQTSWACLAGLSEGRVSSTSSTFIMTHTQKPTGLTVTPHPWCRQTSLTLHPHCNTWIKIKHWVRHGEEEDDDNDD